MSVTLAQARARVLSLIDDADGKDADETAQDAALKAAHQAVYLQACAWAPQRFAKEASVTTSSTGAADLSSIDPIRIMGVSLVSGASRLPVAPVNLSDGPLDVAGVRTLKMTYLPPATFPALAADAFTWGQSGLDLPLLDELMCLRAASGLSALMDQPNGQLERLIERAERDAQNVANFSTWRVLPLRGRSRDSGLGYVMTDAVTLQIVRL